mgnify:CR=1 FL=1
MRILMAHNFYQQPGGEDQSFAAESGLLERYGHTVFRYEVRNTDIVGRNFASLAIDTVWNQSTYSKIRKIIREEGIEIAHFQNTFPIMSPSVYHAARAEGVPVIQSLRNYRLLCPNALFFRDGHVCEDCMHSLIPWPSIYHGCYRDSRAVTGVTASMLVTHRILRTWTQTIDCYIALTEFSKNKFIEGGLPANKIIVKPNFVLSDPGIGIGDGSFALFVGRLTSEKGVETLLSAWQSIGRHLPLKIAGDGPLASVVEKAVEHNPAIEWLGYQSSTEILALMKRAHLLIFPSQWYEGFPRVIVEAYAVGLPVIASNIGSMSSLILHKRTGLHFQSGNVEDLVEQVMWVCEHPQDYQEMRRAARVEFESKYTAEQNYRMMMDVYAFARRNLQ